VKTIVDDIMEKMPEQFNMAEIMAKVEERTPYVIVCFQVKRLSIAKFKKNFPKFCSDSIVTFF
jgi:hypothetical protein